MPIEIDKPLPHNEQAERSLLGAALIDTKSAVEILALIRPDDFFNSYHQTIFRHIESVHAQGGAPDLVTVSDSLRVAGKLEAAGGGAYIASLIDGVPRVSNLPHYADIVRKNAKLRSLIHCCDAICRDAWDGNGTPEQLIESAVSQVLSVADGDSGTAAPRLWKDVAASAMQSVKGAIDHPETAKRINFGLSDLDDMTGGLRRKELVLIVAPTSNGKSLLASQCAFQADRDGFQSLYFSAEMPAEQLAMREIAYQAGVKFYFAQRPENLSPDEYSRLLTASQREHSVRIVDRDITPARVFAMAEAAKRTRGLDLVVVDYDQLVIEAAMNPDSEDDNVFRHQRAFVLRAKKLAERLDICFVLLSQLRALAGRSEGRTPAS